MVRRDGEKTALRIIFNSISKLILVLKFEIYGICIGSNLWLNFQSVSTLNYQNLMAVLKKPRRNEKSENAQSKAASMNRQPHACTSSILQASRQW